MIVSIVIMNNYTVLNHYKSSIFDQTTYKPNYMFKKASLYLHTLLIWLFFSLSLIPNLQILSGTFSFCNILFMFNEESVTVSASVNCSELLTEDTLKRPCSHLWKVLLQFQRVWNKNSFHKWLKFICFHPVFLNCFLALFFQIKI